MSASQGRFTSVDPLMASAKASEPQTWNRYSYGLNNPLRFTDPTGQYICDGTDEQCKQFEKTRAEILKSKDADARRAATAYGAAKDDNGVRVRFDDKLQDRGGTVSPVDGGLSGDPNDASRVRANLLVTIQTGNIRNQETIAHEGSHVADYQAFANSLSATNPWGDQSLNISDAIICPVEMILSAMEMPISMTDIVISAFETNFFTAEISISAADSIGAGFHRYGRSNEKQRRQEVRCK